MARNTAQGPGRGQQPPRLDLDPASREALEFDRVLERVADCARTAPGARRVASLAPVSDAALLAAEIDAVRETSEASEAEGRLVPGGLPDPEAPLRLLEVEGTRLEPTQLRDVAAVLEAAWRLRARLTRGRAAGSPLMALGAAIGDLRAEAAPILEGVDSEGALADHASPELRRLRRELTRIGERLQKLLTGVMRRPGHEPVIRDEFVTQRNGRFVIPVRSDAPRRLAGIVHASSSSGATRFVEPLEAVSLNNERGRLTELEQQEVERILTGWTESLRRRLDEVHPALDAVATIDGLEARVEFGKLCGGVLAEVSDGAPVKLDDARHPLLDLRLRETDERAVPLDVVLDPGDQVLVLSGPNTGGKTVALKTLGLAVLMAQCAIPFPAKRLVLPRYRQLRADIGDHQSIAADLSTYSAHVRAMAACLEGQRAPGLVLFDEIGSGTEPAEGAALARAILESLVASGMTAMATTHQEALKAWALTTEGAQAAAMDFDTATLRPTYRIRMGEAGVSAGLDIAARLGVAPALIERARGFLEPDRVQSDRYARRLRELAADAERRQAELAERERQLEEETERLRSAQARDRSRLEGEARRELETALTRFRQAAERELRSIRDAGAQGRARREAERATRRVAREHARELGTIAPPEAEKQQAGWVPAGELREGMRVRVRSLGREGTVRRAAGRRVEVLLGSMALTVDRDDTLVPADPAAAARPTPPSRPMGRVAAGRGASQELKLIGMRVEEALGELDKFLDAAALAGHTEVRVIHGHGTGRLRRAVREFLADHIHVKSRRAGGDREGGEGATVVELHPA